MPLKPSDPSASRAQTRRSRIRFFDTGAIVLNFDYHRSRVRLVCFSFLISTNIHTATCPLTRVIGNITDDLQEITAITLEPRAWCDARADIKITPRVDFAQRINDLLHDWFYVDAGTDGGASGSSGALQLVVDRGVQLP